MGKAGEYGTFEQALGVEDHIVRSGSQGIPALPDFSPGSLVEQGFPPAAYRDCMNIGHTGMQSRDVGKAFLDQPVDLQVRYMGVDVRDNWQVVNDISQ